MWGIIRSVSTSNTSVVWRLDLSHNTTAPVSRPYTKTQCFLEISAFLVSGR